LHQEPQELPRRLDPTLRKPEAFLMHRVLLLATLRLATLLLLAVAPEALAAGKHRPPQRRPTHSATVDLPGAATPDTHPPLPQATGCPHWLFFRNDSGVPLDLQVGPQPKRVLGRNQIARACVTGERMDWAVSARSGWQYGGVADVADLTRRTVILQAPGANLKIVNQSGDVQELTLDDHEAGKVKAGEERMLGPLPAGRHKLLARGQHGREWRAAAPVSLPGETATVLLEPLATATEVTNTTQETVGVRIDGAPWGTLAPGAAVSILGLVPGPHQMTWVGEKSGDIRALTVTAASSSQPPGASPEVRVHVSNQTGEALQLPEALRDLGPTLEPGQTADWQLKRGTYGVSLRGQASGLDYKLGMHADRDEPTRDWTITRPRAMLRLQNAAGEPVTVAVADVGAIDLGVGDGKDLDVPAGRVSIAADTRDTGRRLSAGMFLKPGAGTTWLVHAALTAVTVHNEDMEPVLVKVDGELRGQIEPTRDLRFELDPGRHEFALLGLLTGAQAEGTVVLRDGDRKGTTFVPPDGTVLVDHAAHEGTLTVLVRGVQAAEVQPKTRAAVPVLPGRLVVEVRDKAAGRSEIWQGKVAPMQQVRVLEPALETTGVQAVFEGQARQVRVWLDDGEATPLVPGTPWRQAGLRPGRHLLHVDVDGREMRRYLELDGHRAWNRVLLREERLP
jgi:hypothetical protein